MVNVTTIRAVATSIPGLAFVLTMLRLHHRWQLQQLGYDDGWAAFSLLSVFWLVAGEWMYSDEPGIGPLSESIKIRIVGYYMASFGFTCVIWSARMSILFSVVRVIPPAGRLLKFAYASACLFACMWVTLIIQKAVICERNDAWKLGPRTQCRLGSSVATLEVANDCVSDAILIFIPIRLLWDASIKKGDRKLLMSVFSASLLTTIISIVHDLYLFTSNRDMEAIMAHVEASTALVICNLAVLAVWFRRTIFYRSRVVEETEASSRTFPPLETGSQQLTSISYFPTTMSTSGCDHIQSNPSKSECEDETISVKFDGNFYV